MTRDVKIIQRARDDLNRIYRWLHRRSPRGAVAWYRAFWSAATRIANDPESFAVAEESAQLKSDIRSAIFKTRKGRYYRIIFEFTDTEARILRVRRPGQRPLQRRDLPAG